MVFVVNGKRHTLKGISTKRPNIDDTGLMELLPSEHQDTVAQLVSPTSSTPLPSINRHPSLDTLLSYYDILFAPPTTLPPARSIDHHITLLPNTTPINVRPYKYAYSQKTELETQGQDMLSQGIIQPSTSPFSSPVILIKKKEGTWRFCVDYRALNVVTIKDRFPIPAIDELLDELHGSNYFFKLDLYSGYHQIRMFADDIPKTAFQTHEGYYEFVAMPFGLSNAPSTFQPLMNQIFRPFLRKFVLMFFDDILAYSKDWDYHLHHLKQVFDTLYVNQLKVKLSKCSFAQPQVQYLGHIISTKCVAMDPEKVQCIQDWPKPLTVKALRGFLGLVGYYYGFIQHFGLIAKPFTDMLKHDNISWNPYA